MELVAKYDGFMPDNMRSQVGMNVNVPLWQEKRWRRSARHRRRLHQRQAEYQDRLDQIRFEVQSAYEQLVEGKEVVRLFDEKILPTAEQNVQSGRANYIGRQHGFSAAGRGPSAALPAAREIRRGHGRISPPCRDAPARGGAVSQVAHHSWRALTVRL